MSWIHCSTIIFVLAPIQNHPPLLINFIEIQRGQVWYCQECEYRCSKGGVAADEEQGVIGLGKGE
eukprot:9386009-Alexandrium_andersonii.AAC.1